MVPSFLQALRPSSARWCLALPVALLSAACSTSDWNRRADDQVYGIIREKQLTLFGEKIEFDIETPHSESDANEIEAIEILSGRRVPEERRIDLEQAIAISEEQRREYQTEKEALYLVGLDLTRARHDFSPRLSAGSRAELNDFNRPASGEEPRQESRDLAVRSRAGFDLLLRTGGAVAVDLAQDIFRFYLGGSGGGGSTRFLSAGINQPLLRGSGRTATENLTQRERNVVYAIRSFSRFQERNAIDIVTAYSRILQEKDRVRNEYANYRNIIAFTERATELAVDRLPRFQVDQARQDELRARNRYILAVDSYRSLIDNFKLTLGLPVGGDLWLEDDVLRAFEARGLTPLPIALDDAIEIAVTHRLDLLNEIDRFEDAQRRLKVAADAFLPGLNLFANLDLDSDNRSGRSIYSNFDMDAYRSRVGLDLNLPLDNLDARNSVRRARIDFERQLRQLSLAIDRIQADLRSGLRGLELARQRFEIQQNALELANQRVEAVNLLLEVSRAETRDLLEARNDLLGARNAVTAALIDYHITRINFLFDLGIFDPKLERFWVENPKIPQVRRDGAPAERDQPATDEVEDLITPEQLFQEPTRDL